MLRLQETNERINANTGLTSVGLLLQDISFGNRECHGNGISDHDVLMSMTGLLCQSQVHYEDIENYREDPAFSAMLGLSRVPSSSLLCQRMNHLGDDAASHARLEAVNTTLLSSQVMGACTIGNDQYLPVDIDVSPMDNGGSKREHVGRTYKGCDGFAPIFAYIGTEGWLLHHELRPGIQHCQKDTPAFIEACFEQLESLQLTHPVCVRLDSGNDSADTLAVLRTSKYHFIVKRNRRLEDKAQWLETARSLGDPTTQRPGKDVYTGTVDHLVPGGYNSDQESLTVVYRVVHRTIDKHGQHLLIPTIEVETYWTNLWYNPVDIIASYHERGTSEQYHSELKTDIGIERLPSYAFGTNQLCLRLASIAYNTLRIIGVMAIQARNDWPKLIKSVQRRRLRSIIKDLILVGGKYIRHAGATLLKVNKHNLWCGVLMSINRSLLK